MADFEKQAESYPTDLTGEAWALIVPFLPPVLKEAGRRHPQAVAVIDAPLCRRHLEVWLHTDPPHLELATLAFEELKARGKDDRAGRLFQARGLAPIGWLMEARKVAATILPPSPSAQHVGHVYAVLRWGYPAQNGTYGVYVGSTTKGVAKRFVEHRTGINHGKSLPTYGIEPLYSLFQWANPFPVKGKLRTSASSSTHRGCRWGGEA